MSHPFPAQACYAAPEMLTAHRSRPICGFEAMCRLDVFAFGIVTAATFSQNGDPYHFYVTPDAPTPTDRERAIASAVTLDGLRPQVPAALPESVRPLMESCWATDPTLRPTFFEISNRLRRVAASQGTVALTTSTKLPLGPDAVRDSESSDTFA